MNHPNIPESPQTPAGVCSSELVSLPVDAKLEQVKVVISQESDCCAPQDIGNELEIETHDGGAGKYLVLSGRWAMDDEHEINSLANMLKEILRKAG